MLVPYMEKMVEYIFFAPWTLVLMHSNGLYSAVGTIFVAAAWTT